MTIASDPKKSAPGTNQYSNREFHQALVPITTLVNCDSRIGEVLGVTKGRYLAIQQCAGFCHTANTDLPIVPSEMRSNARESGTQIRSHSSTCNEVGSGCRSIITFPKEARTPALSRYLSFISFHPDGMSLPRLRLL